MKKTYVRSPQLPKKDRKTSKRTKQTVNSRVPERALTFFRNISVLASSYILRNLRLLSRDEQTAMQRHAKRVLRYKPLTENETLRNGAVRLIVALLPKTFPALEELLSDSPRRYGMRFTLRHSQHWIGTI